MKHAVRLAITVSILSVPAMAVACPTCAAGDSASQTSILPLLAGFLSLPFLLGAIVIGVLRQEARNGAKQRS